MPALTVQIVHGGLDEASYPLLIGHATGTPISGAESRCDDLLYGELTNLQMLGLYPDRAGESRYVQRSKPEQRLRGCLILGLDSSEPLLTSTLIEQVERAVLDYAVHEDLETSSERGGDTSARPPLGLSAVPIGSGPMFDVSPERSCIAIVRGVQRANEALNAIGHRLIERLELIDRYAARVERLVLTMEKTVESQSWSANDAQRLELAAEPDERPGARTGNLPPGYDVGIWEGLSVEVVPSRELDDRVRYLSYRFTRNRAAVGENQRRVDRGVVADLLAAAVAAPAHSVAVGQVLLEELLPIEVIDELSRTENLVLQVDARTADIPWELLGDRVVGVAPLACRSGLLRQFRMPDLAVRKVARRANTALVIGDPPTNFHPLPGAREEAQDVARQLRAASVDVHHVEFPASAAVGTATSAALVRTALRGRDHRIIHIAAHGLTEVVRSRRAGSELDDGEGTEATTARSEDLDDPVIEGGIPIGPGSLLVADDFRNLRMAPEFVFLNCCHLGRARPVEGPAGERLLDPVEQQLAAASLAYRLMGIGVKAVVVAGWQVRDDLASRFAMRLYESLLDGVPYGDAVRDARTACFNETRATDNTWAAYQCYGDPGFRLVPGANRTGVIESVATRAAALRELEELDARASEVEDPATLRSGAEKLEGEVLRRWRGDGRLWSACGRLWSDLGDYQRAVDCYDRAVKALDGSAPLSALEQLANLRSRDAVQRLRTVPDHASIPKDVEDAIDQAFRQVLLTSEMLAKLDVPTSERSAIDGATYKRLAVIERIVTRRQHWMRLAIQRYTDAFRLDPAHDLYGFRNALQLCAISGDDLGELLSEPSSVELWAADIVRDQGIGGYFARVGRADSRLTAILVTPQSAVGTAIRKRIDEWARADSPPGASELRALLDADITEGIDSLAEEYRSVRPGGYPIRNWRSTVEHIWELAFLAAEPAKAALTRLHEALPHS